MNKETVPGEQRGETVELCDICGQPLVFPKEGDPEFAGKTMVTSKCRHVIQSYGAPGEQRGETPKFKHVCPEWDGLEIDETWPEFEACLCFRAKVEARPLPARPEKIERWDLQEDKLGKFMKIVPSGEFVRWYQYAALEAQLSRQESAEDAWKRGIELAAKLACQYWGSSFGVVLTDLLKTPYTPPISPDKEGQ